MASNLSPGKSVMRDFLESDVDFTWPSGLGETSGTHCDFKVDIKGIPLLWKKKISDKKASIDLYEAHPDYNYKFKKSFVVKTIREPSSKKARDVAANEVNTMRDLRHPHITALLATFMYQERLSILIFPAACCDLHQFMKQISKDFQSIHSPANHPDRLDGHKLTLTRSNSTTETDSTASVAHSHHGPDSDVSEKRSKGHHGIKTQAWPLKAPFQQKLDCLRRYFICLSEALKYLHESDVRHKDIKPKNILIDESGAVILTDFGISRRFAKHTSHVTNNEWKFTRKYASPEIMKGKRVERDDPSDVFSLGCVFLEMATLLLGRDLDNLASHYATTVNQTGLEEAYHCNLDKVYTWIDSLRTRGTRTDQEQPHQAESILSQDYAPDPEQSVTESLIHVRKMLDEDPKMRPKSRDLWACFGSINPEKCRDCDPRLEERWKPSNIALAAAQDMPSLDSQSIYSIEAPSLTSASTLSSAISIQGVEGAAEQFAKLLLADKILHPLCVEALERIDAEKLERNFARLLQICAKDLRGEATTLLQKNAVRLMRQQARHIANYTWKQLNPSREERYANMDQLSSQKIENQDRIEQYVQRLNLSGVQDCVDGVLEPTPKKIEQPDSESEESDEGVADQQSLSTFQHIKPFITNSEAFAKLRENFRAFVTPESEHRHTRHPDGAVAGEAFPIVDDQQFRSKKWTDPGTDSAEASAPKPSSTTISGRRLRRWSQRSRYYDALAQAYFLAAEFFGLCEKAIPAGMKRVRWKCVCGCKLYDDFYEQSPGALRALRDHLERSYSPAYRCAAGMGSTHMTSSRSDVAPQSQSNQIQAAEMFPNQTSQTSQDICFTGKLRQRSQGKLNAKEPEQPQTDDRWILPIFEYKRNGRKAVHLPVGVKESDEAFFLALRRNYLKSTNGLKRYLSLRGVKKIHYVHFVLTDRGADIRKWDDWPLEHHSQHWHYEGCPPAYIPHVGPTLLMHLWQYPSDTDQQTFDSFEHWPLHVVRRMMCSLSNCLTEFIRHKISNRPQQELEEHTPNDARGTNTAAIQTTAVDREEGIELSNRNNQCAQRDPELQEQPKPCSSYVFLRTPKKIGERLLPDDVAPPDGWGLYFEEGLVLGRFFLFILFLYLLGSLIFAISWYRIYGSVGAQSGLGSFGVSSWMVGLASLVMTTWFKWAE